MKLQEIAILLPCHSLEDFPSEGDAATADGLFAAWTSLWHPTLLAAAGRKPTWYRADNPPSEFAGRLFVVPPVSETRLLAGWTERARQGGATVVLGQITRRAIVDEALACLDAGMPGVDDETAADFFALGFAFLQVELLTRQMRYMSNLDQIHLENQSVAAARAAVSGDTETANAHLNRCFESLQEARERFYPVDSYLIDLTLVAETTLHDGLRRELERGDPTSVLASGEVLEKLFAAAPANGQLLKEAIARGRASIVGGEWCEGELPLWPVNDVIDNFVRGLASYEQRLGRRPTVFGRRRAGLSPMLPQLLTRLGFRAALHLTLDDGLFPKSDQSRVRWEGTDRSVIDCVARVPLDAGRPESFLGLCRAMGDAMDRDQVATMVFAHWPDKACVWYDDLRRAARRCDCLGKFTTLDDYFTQTTGSGRLSRFEPEKYRTPYLHQAAAHQDSKPASATIERHELAGARFQAETLAALGRVLGCQATSKTSPTESELADARLRADACAGALADCLARGNRDPKPGVLVFNPHSAPRTGVVGWPAAWGIVAPSTPATPQQVSCDRMLALVSVPALGYTWLPLAHGAIPSLTKAEASMVEGHVMRNEFLEVTIAPDTGALKSLRDFRVRGTLLSQQIARRWPGERPRPGESWRDPDEIAVYSVMAADNVEVLSGGPALAEIRTRGRLMHPEGSIAARFEQTYRLARGSRVLEIDLEFMPEETPSGNPWESYFAARFAWADAAADVHRSIAGGSYATEAKQVEAPQFIEIQDAKRRLAIYTGGAPYHRRAGMRMLDTMLIPPGETRRRFQLAVGVDAPYPYHEAWSQWSGLVVAPAPAACPAGGPSSWLFHVDAKNLLAVRWAPLEQGGRNVGVTARLLETAGRAGKASIRGFKTLTSARQVDYLGQTLTELSTSGDAATIEFNGSEWLDIELRWAKRMIVTIDGPAGAGKSTASRELAQRLGFRFLDTGAMYRAVALAAMRRGHDWLQEDALATLARSINVQLTDTQVLLDGEDVSRTIRSMEVTSLTHFAANNSGVRRHLVELQRRAAGNENVVTEGRDQGTVVFPGAECKIFLTASPEERARRRLFDLQRHGEQVSFEEVLAKQIERDERDASRVDGPLRQADDATVLCTDGLTEEEVVDRLVQIVESRMAAVK